MEWSDQRKQIGMAFFIMAWKAYTLVYTVNIPLSQIKTKRINVVRVNTFVVVQCADVEYTLGTDVTS